MPRWGCELWPDPEMTCNLFCEDWDTDDFWGEAGAPWSPVPNYKVFLGSRILRLGNLPVSRPKIVACESSAKFHRDSRPLDSSGSYGGLCKKEFFSSPLGDWTLERILRRSLRAAVILENVPSLRCFSWEMKREEKRKKEKIIKIVILWVQRWLQMWEGELHQRFIFLWCEAALAILAQLKSCCGVALALQLGVPAQLVISGASQPLSCESFLLAVWINWKWMFFILFFLFFIWM